MKTLSVCFPIREHLAASMPILGDLSHLGGKRYPSRQLEGICNKILSAAQDDQIELSHFESHLLFNSLSQSVFEPGVEDKASYAPLLRALHPRSEFYSTATQICAPSGKNVASIDC